MESRDERAKQEKLERAETAPSERRGLAIPIVAGAVMQLAFGGMVLLGDLRQHTLSFLGLFGLAGLAYVAVVVWLLRRPDRRNAWPLVLGLALLFRLTLFFTTPPTLSDDVYRYVWDGRVVNAGVNPYAHPVDSPQLDFLDTPQRSLVNHDWMASPYLPAAQALFALVYRLAPDSPLAFQIAAVAFDLLTAWLLLDLLRRLDLPPLAALIYLWNPLVVVEFAHGAHVDSLMIALMMAALWLGVRFRSQIPSAAALAAATLTKGLPALLLPVLARRWRWRSFLVYGGLVAAACIPFALGAGWGLIGATDGVGLFGALRIYARYWNYNGSLYRLLENLLSGQWTPGATAPEPTALAVRLAVAALMGLVLIAVWRQARRSRDDLALLRLSLAPLGAYLLLTTTVHPWYVTLIVPFLPLLLPQAGTTSRATRFLWPGLYYSLAVALSYYTYVDPANLREYGFILLVEYVPLYLLLIWAVWPARGGAGRIGEG